MNPGTVYDTSTGAYLEIYMSPHFIVDDDFDSSTDCRFENVDSSAICILDKTPTHLKLTIKSSDSNLNPIPYNTGTVIYIYNLKP